MESDFQRVEKTASGGVATAGDGPSSNSSYRASRRAGILADQIKALSSGVTARRADVRGLWRV